MFRNHESPQKVLQECRNTYGGFRGLVSRMVRPFKVFKAPDWVRHPNRRLLLETFNHQSLLIKRGQVCWGAFVQANGELMQPGTSDHPGCIVYSYDSMVDANPSILTDFAKTLSSLKGGTPEDPDLQLLVNIITDECTDALCLPIPKYLTKGVQCSYSSIYVFREHLSNRVLSGWLVPILVSPEQTGAVMVLPSRFWSKSFAKYWEGK